MHVHEFEPNPRDSEGQESLACCSPWDGKELDTTEQLKDNKCWFTQSCLTLCDLMDCSLPGSCVHGISQARTLEWVVISSSRESFWPDIKYASPASSAFVGRFFTTAPPGKFLSLDYKGLQGAQSVGETSSSVLGQGKLPKEETLQLKLSPGWLRNPPKGECRNWLYISMFPTKQHYAHNSRRKREYGPFVK